MTINHTTIPRSKESTSRSTVTNTSNSLAASASSSPVFMVADAFRRRVRLERVEHRIENDPAGRVNPYRFGHTFTLYAIGV